MILQLLAIPLAVLAVYLFWRAHASLGRKRLAAKLAVPAAEARMRRARLRVGLLR